MNKKTVSINAVRDRLKRYLLKHESVELKKCRHDSPFLADYGEWYTVREDGIADTHLDLEKVARGYGVLKTFEELEQE